MYTAALVSVALASVPVWAQASAALFQASVLERASEKALEVA